MGINFYLKRTKPILVFPEFHISKRSSGWKGLYHANHKREDWWSFETERPVVRSLDDIRSHVDSGEWEIVDEYGCEYGYDDFVSYMEDDFPQEKDHGRQSHAGTGIGCFIAPDGTEWCDRDFG